MRKIVLVSTLLICMILPRTVIADVIIEDTYISTEAQRACADYGKQYGICPELLMAIIEVESAGKPYATNGDCIGLMQVSERWHADRMRNLGVTDLFDERQNILVGTDYLAELFSEYGDVCLVLDKYNGNSKAQYNYDTGIVSDYSQKILKRSAELERLHGK